LTDLARTHAEIVLVLAAMTLGLLYLLERTKAPAKVVGRGRLLLAAMVAQGVVGYSQYFSHLPPLLVGVHVFGVTILWTAMLWFSDGLFHHPATESVVGNEGPGGEGRRSDSVPAAVDIAPLARSGSGR
jgi:cytochrome c oxidase assembly protein subunit 15